MSEAEAVPLSDRTAVAVAGRVPDALPLTLPVPLTPADMVALPLGVREAQEEALALGKGDEDGVAVAQPEELGEEVED